MYAPNVAKKRVAINGFGRIGRMVLRAFADQKNPNFEIVAINDLGSPEANLHLFKYDSIHGRYQNNATLRDNEYLDVGFGNIKLLKQGDPKLLPWGELNIDIVLECTGRFTKRSEAAEHLQAGAKRVIISAPAENADITVVYGINQQNIKPTDLVISNASCTTNCLAPVAAFIDEHLGIEMGYMTTIHAYTGDQKLVDTLHSDLRRARAATLSMIPSSTGAAKAVGLVLPNLKGKLDGTAIRVPVANVSMIDLKCVVKRDTTIAEINAFAKAAASSPQLTGILEYVDEPLVSIDFNHSSFSCSFDATQTQVVQNRLVRVVAWYDNEWGFSNRLVDLCNFLSIS